MLVSDSDKRVSRSEFCLLFMKFARNPMVADRLEYIDRLLGKILDFDKEITEHLDLRGPFREMIVPVSDETRIAGRKWSAMKEEALSQIKELTLSDDTFIGDQTW